ncbi:UDP-N-acetylglucosamine 1-carboxyvinyltransferase [Patescibacteria group bacterium]|nr:UDP-N-acetylglucosamine 1-carboxyvinyltransferase [Patescibacteria group bacterium]
MQGCIRVKGGNKLIGEVVPIANKNAILAALPACLLTDKDVTYHNVPQTSDVKKILSVLQKLGAKVDSTNFNKIVINCSQVNSYAIDLELGKSIRSSILFAGPLLARFGKAIVPLPGGCLLGKRSIAAHIDVFKKAGISCSINDLQETAEFFVESKLVNTALDIWMSEASVTATENIAMYAAGTSTPMTIRDAACEPHVVQLLELLKDTGAKISGIGSNVLHIEGSKGLAGFSFTPWPDHIDIAGYIAAVAMCGGKIVIKNANLPQVMNGILDWFKLFGVDVYPQGANLVAEGTKLPQIDYANLSFPLAGDHLPKFIPRPWPGFPVDLLPIMITLACKNKGSIMMQNWMYESGLDFTRELNKLGADILTCDPQRVIVNGRINFKGGELVSPNVIQACMALFLAGMADPVETVLHGVQSLNRRYANIFESYRHLGADIEVLED